MKANFTELSIEHNYLIICLRLDIDFKKGIILTDPRLFSRGPLHDVLEITLSFAYKARVSYVREY